MRRNSRHVSQTPIPNTSPTGGIALDRRDFEKLPAGQFTTTDAQAALHMTRRENAYNRLSELAACGMVEQLKDGPFGVAVWKKAEEA